MVSEQKRKKSDEDEDDDTDNNDKRAPGHASVFIELLGLW